MNQLTLQQEDNVRIRINLSTEIGVSGSQLTKIISSIEKACFMQEMETVLSLLPIERDDIQNIVWKILKDYELDRPPILLLKDAQSGSLIFEGIIIAATTWVLLNTLGETFKDAWKESTLHEKLKEALLRGRKNNVKKLSDEIHQKLRNIKESEQSVITDFSIEIIENDSLININLKIEDKVGRLERMEFPTQRIEEILESIERHGT